MITGKKEELDDIAKNYVCKEDEGYLSVIWYGIVKDAEHMAKVLGRRLTPQEVADGGLYTLRCEHNHFPEEVTRQPTLTEMYKQGEVLPGTVEDNIKKSIEMRAARLPRAPQAVTFSGVPATDLGTGELLPRDTLEALVKYAEGYGLDPARGHVCLMYGKPYITLDGYLYHAKKEKIPYSLYGKPLDENEKKLYQIPENAYAWLSTVQFADKGNYTTGIGIVTKEELEEKSKKDPSKYANPVLRKHPVLQARKRGDWQALRRAFPIGESKEEENK